MWPSNSTTVHIFGENHNSKRQCTQIFIAALFTIARTWKKPKCPPREEWIKKIWYICTKGYCLVLSCSVSRLFVTPKTAAHQAPLSMEILQARILEWVAMPFSRGPSQPRDQAQVSHNAGGFFTVLSHQGSPWILEWVAYSFSRGSFQSRDRTEGLLHCRWILYQLRYQGIY